MCIDIEKKFNFQIITALINKSSPHFRRDMDLFIIDTLTSER